MRHVPASAVRAKFAEVMNEAAAGDRVMIQRHGKDVAAVISIGELERFQMLEAQARERER